MRKIAAFLPVVAGLVIAGFTWNGGAETTSQQQEPIDLRSDQPTYESLVAMLAEADLVVVGPVREVIPGRIYTDPENPRAGIKSQFATIEVDSTIIGAEKKSVVVEQAAELLDGTPVEVDSSPPLTDGDRVLAFLIVTANPGQRDYGILNRQGLYKIDEKTTLELLGSATNPPIESLHGLTLQEAVRRIRLNEQDAATQAR